VALTIAKWASNTSGFWTTPGDWSDGIVPGQGTNTNIGALFTGGRASYTVTLAGGNKLNVGTGKAAVNTDVALQADDQFVTLDISGNITTGSAGHAITELNLGAINVESGGLFAVANTYTQTGGEINVGASGSFTVAKHAGVSVTLSGGTIAVAGGTITTTGNLNQSGGIIDISGGTLSVAAAATLKQTSGSILIGDGTLDTGSLTQTGGTIGFVASGGLLQFGIGGTPIDVRMSADGVTDTVAVTSNKKFSNLTLANFFAGDVLKAATAGPLSNGSVAYSGSDSAGTLTITGTVSGSAFKDVVHITTPGAITPTSSNFTLSSGSNSFGVTSGVVCFARGTRILTPTGDRFVESLNQGEMVLALSGGALTERPVKWLGRRLIDLTAHPRPETVAPIRIQRDAFADNIPHSDLLVSPDHAIFMDGILICARQLINGATIRQEKGRTSVEYYHVELDAHSILLAEGLPAESYLDTGNRGFFANSGEPLRLHSDLTGETDYPTREAASCAPFVSVEASVRPVWHRLAERAAALDQPVPQLDTTTDPKLRIIANGRPLLPSCADGGHYIFVLPKGLPEVRLVSHAGAPTDARPWLEDRRRLGVCVQRIVLDGSGDVQEVPLDHPNLSQGWWAVEWDGAAPRRWTDGAALLPLPPCVDPVMLRIDASPCGMTYAIDAI
jgi:hypothetical protein